MNISISNGGLILISLIAISVFVFDFKSSIYGEKIKIKFLEKIRDEKKFKNLHLLKKQLIKDKITSIKIIEKNEKIRN